MDLSIVIPAHNEGMKIERDVTAAAAFLAGEGLAGEILVVDDGSDDDTAEAASAADVPPGVTRRVLRYVPQRGKGHAVRTGMAETRGRIAMFADSGLCVPLDNAIRGIELIESGECDLAHGSRWLTASRIDVPQPLSRRVLSRSFRAFTSLALGLPRDLTDTQCGFKLYRGDVGRALYATCETEGFAFDVEIILRAVRRRYRIREFPVEWCCDLDSRLHPGRSAPNVLRELLAIQRRVRREPDA